MPPTTRRRVSPPDAYHYCRLQITPIPTSSSTSQLKPIDPISLAQICSSVLEDFFGAVGGNGAGNSIEVITCRRPLQGVKSNSVMVEGEEADDDGVREAILRFPSSSTVPILTSLPLSSPSYDAQEYRIKVLSSSPHLERLSGVAGKGMMGYKEWTRVLKAESAHDA